GHVTEPRQDRVPIPSAALLRRVSEAVGAHRHQRKRGPPGLAFDLQCTECSEKTQTHYALYRRKPSLWPTDRQAPHCLLILRERRRPPTASGSNEQSRPFSLPARVFLESQRVTPSASTRRGFGLAPRMRH